LYILVSFALAFVGAGVAWYVVGNPLLEVIAAVILGGAPFFKLKLDQSRRLSLFEEQLGGALDVMIRALQAGYPFTETLRHVAREMQDPIAMEFQIAFDEINAGIDFRSAFRNMLRRVPSLSLMAVATTVALQRETGGNLAESLSNISSVIRGRFVFYRKVKTLTAEGRVSAWVLALMPFGLFVMMYFMQPDMMIKFITDPSGQNVIYIGLILLTVGIFWIRQLLDLDI
jgi:tight adherence protein B